jgi:hypothetical protein
LELIDLMELLACAGFDWGVENRTEDDISRPRRGYYLAFTDGLEREDLAAASAAGGDFSTIGS